jgi:hypothetical protein
MPLAAWNVYVGGSYYQKKSTTRKSLENLLSACFGLLTYINIGSTCVVYTVTSRVFREELRALFQFKWLKKFIRQQQQSVIFYISRRIGPA